jgi:predicted nicotinamide N-methyase
MHDSTLQEISISIGRLRVFMAGPRDQSESGERISFWWGLTSAAVALSRHLEARGALRGERIVELGCGLGLAGITAGLLGAKVTFTDYVATALAHAEQNCRLNGVASAMADFVPLDWEDPGDIGKFSLALGSEILYDYFTHSALIDLLERILEPNGTILFADRKRLVVSRFLGRLAGKGFKCTEETIPVRIEGFPEQDITIFALNPPA